MSKLTDKIEAAIQYGNKCFPTQPAAGRLADKLIDILADVRELEQQATAWTTQQRYVAIARQAKREAYEHARHLNNVVFYGNAGQQASNLDRRLENAINALNTEGGDNE